MKPRKETESLLLCLEEIYNPVLQAKGHQLTLPNDIQRFFEEWLSNIVRLAGDELTQYERAGENFGETPIVLAGLGSGPEFIKQYMQA